MIIGLTGYAEAGKDSVGKILVEKYGFARVAFADKLKELALELNPALASVVKELGWDFAKQDPETRQYLQWLGTDICRKVLGDDIWTRQLESLVWKLSCDGVGGRIVITDVRFVNEAKTIKEMLSNGCCQRGGLIQMSSIIRVDRPGHKNTIGLDHPSESSVDEITPDLVIKNAGTLQDLEDQVDEIILQFFCGGRLF